MNIMVSTEKSLPPVYNISDVTRRLAAPRKEIEHDFFQMGEKLIAGTRLLNETAGAYSQMAGALAGPEFSELTRLLKDLSGNIVRVDQARHATQEFLTDLGGMTNQFSSCTQHLTTTVRILRSFFVTARVTAAVSGNEEVNLLQFTDQFSDLGIQLDGHMSSFIDAFKSMRSSLDAAASVNEKLGVQHADLLDGIATEQTNNLESLENRRIWAEGRISTHADRSEGISAKISRAVGTLQVGDSTRQRVEHVEEALKSLEGVDDETTLSVVQNLMAMQVFGAISDFDGDIVELVKSVEELIEDTKVLLQTADEDSKILLSSGDTALGVIDNSLQRTARMLEQYERGNAVRSVAIDQLVNAVSKMLDHIGDFDEIRRSIRLLSLNSTLKAKALNEEGRAFQKVASDLRSLSDETNTPVDEMMKNLQKSEVLLRKFLDSRASGKDDVVSDMQDAVRKASQCVAGVTSEFRLHANCMSKTGPEALSQLNLAASTVRDRQDFCAAWRTVASELSTPVAQEGLKAITSSENHEVLLNIYRNYTMTAERNIHNRLLGLEAEEDSQPTREGGQLDGSGLDDIFF